MYNCFLRPNPFVVVDDGAWVEMEAVVRWALINLGFPLVGGRKSIYTFQRSCEGGHVLKEVVVEVKASEIYRTTVIVTVAQDTDRRATCNQKLIQ